ncbi:NAD-dependent epimerase/dehydratase family protein [Pseudomonas putida]|uniref:NAD-dependent epimerase/dehydratase family protein n=1 Tax=Pseudomonas putida TaxID=303 RepID=A0A2Z4RC44_PSEPU|nr:NmrA family NAD(P)-binding protein [Pseudomonas putida]AWY38426.1 NAD-dependent epimerase/dehydratase family protein [Pseudomonas putida]
MTQATILVTGATGDTGRRTIEILTAKGVPVRALVRKEDERSAELRAMGAEVVLGDLLDLNAVRSALEGIRAAYFVYPIAPGLIDATARFAQAAKEAGVEAVINMSQISARREAKSNAALDHWTAERVFDWSGLAVTHLRPTYFAQWLTYPHWRSHIRDKDQIRLPFGDGRHAPIAAEDQARLIAAILQDPTPHQGKSYTLHGPVELSQQGVADAIGEVLGRKISYQPISIEEYKEELLGAGLPAFLVQHLGEVALDYQHGVFEGEDSIIAQVTGQAPLTVQQFVTLHKDLFNA